MAEDAVGVSENITEELDKVIPKHQLLDSTAAKHKNELVHRGTLATRHRPSGEGLRTQILRRQFADSKEGSPVEKYKEQPVRPSPPLSHPKVDFKNNSHEAKKGKSFLADIQGALNVKYNEGSPDEEDIIKEELAEVSRDGKIPMRSPSQGQSLSFLSGMKNPKRQESEASDETTPVSLRSFRTNDVVKEQQTVAKSGEDPKNGDSPTHSPAKGKPSFLFLAGIENAVKRMSKQKLLIFLP